MSFVGAGICGRIEFPSFSHFQYLYAQRRIHFFVVDVDLYLRKCVKMRFWVAT